MLCLGLRCDEHTCTGLLTEIGGAGLLYRSMCCKNVGYGGVDMDGQGNVIFLELLLWDVACLRGRTEVLHALSQMMVLRVVVILVSASLVLVRGEVLYLIILAL